MRKELYKNTAVENFELSYYLLEGGKDTEYGVEVEKLSNNTVEESKAIYDICNEKDELCKFLEKISIGNVTPTTLYDVVSDWVGEK